MREAVRSRSRAFFFVLRKHLVKNLLIEFQLNITPDFLKTRSRVGLWVNVVKKSLPARFAAREFACTRAREMSATW
jgi:hypothetical protein